MRWMGRTVGIFAIATSVARAVTCGKPGEILSALRSTVEGQARISDVLSRLELAGASGAAVLSVSAQSSKGRFDPRVLIFTDCFALTYSLTSPTLEGGVLRLRATEPLAELGRNADAAGEILFEFVPSPKRLHLHVDQWDPKTKHDSLRCTHCHVDTSVTKGPLGATPVEMDGVSFAAVVSPYFDSLDSISSSASWASYCLEEPPRYGAVSRPSDLERLHHCLCTKPRMADPQCRERASELENPWVVPGSEACARLEATIKLGLRQEWRYDPRAFKRLRPCYFAR